MKRLIFECGCDRMECKRVKPYLMPNNTIVTPAETNNGEWCVCIKCDRNKTLGNCYGNIKIVPLQEVEK